MASRVSVRSISVDSTIEDSLKLVGPRWWVGTRHYIGRVPQSGDVTLYTNHYLARAGRPGGAGLRRDAPPPARAHRRKAGPPRGQYAQITLDFDEDERRQLQTNMRYWRTRLDPFDRDLVEHEPGPIRAFYVQAKRVESVGVVYLWQETH